VRRQQLLFTLSYRTARRARRRVGWGLAPLLLALATGARADDTPFSDQRVISRVPDAPRSLWTGDVDGDGDVDVLSASLFDASLRWYENPRADGEPWSVHTISDDTPGAVSVFAADVDGDGDLDALSAAVYANEIAWHENVDHVGGSWRTRVITRHARNAFSVWGSDLDGDGDVDALSASAADDKIAWYENRLGDGSAWIGHVITLDAQVAVAVRAADLDADGDPDVISASQLDDTIAWYENAGDASRWTAHVISSDTDGAFHAVPADLDGDGDLDVVGAVQFDDAIAWYENARGDASTWVSHRIGEDAEGIRSVATADFDGDGDLDALSGSRRDSEITWYENVASRGSQWIARVISNRARQAFSVAVDDVDGDGDVDALSASMGDDEIAWYENQTIHRSAHFPDRVAIAPDAWVRSLTIADLDRDGALDVLGISLGRDGVSWYRNPGSEGDWKRRVISRRGAAASCVSDLDRDGDLDVVAALPGRAAIVWHANGGGGGFGAPLLVSAQARGVRALAAADLDGDTAPDVVAGQHRGLVAYTNSGDGSRWSVHPIAPERRRVLAVVLADFDRDGARDVASASWQGLVWHGNPAREGSAWTTHAVGTDASSTRAIAAADVDADGDTDLIGVSERGITWYANSEAVAAGWSPTPISSDRGAEALEARDVDRDGDVDVVAARRGKGGTTIYENVLGDGSEWRPHAVGWRALDVALGDLDADGDLDLLTARPGRSGLQWHPNQGGQFSLRARDVTPPRIGAGEIAAVLTLTLGHEGRDGDAAIELSALGLRLEGRGGVPTTGDEATRLEGLLLFEDEGSGSFEPDRDRRLLEVGPEPEPDGIVRLALAERVRVEVDEAATLFLAVRAAREVTPGRASLRLVLVADEVVALAGDRASPLSMQHAPDSASGMIRIGTGEDSPRGTRSDVGGWRGPRGPGRGVRRWRAREPPSPRWTPAPRRWWLSGSSYRGGRGSTSRSRFSRARVP
jgi:hypothetical protein